ncbi:uncharacterized protein J3D65DRAFT_654993 [Phyllosticta citribraziliensis]|uniref:Uncharacterized protein n=1 Tax=Phyllosticta citribraziliensis TaxID=989973 RepID=A0ABR1MA64_9PEZI
MRFRTLRLWHILLSLLLLPLFAALAVSLYLLPFNNTIPSSLSPRDDHNMSNSWNDSPNLSDSPSSVESNCSTHPGPTTITAPTSQPSAPSAIPQCLFNATACGAIFSLVQTCHDELFPPTADSGRADDPGKSLTISPTNPAQAARLRSCICSPSSSPSSAADKNAAWSHCQSCLHNDLHASQASLVAQTRALQRFCRAPGVPDAVGWLRGFELWIRELAPCAIGGDGSGRRVLSGGVTGVLSMTATTTGGVTAAQQTLTWSSSTTRTTTTEEGGTHTDAPAASAVTSVYWADGLTTLLIVMPAPSSSPAGGSTAEHMPSGAASSSSRSTADSTAAASTAAATTTTAAEQASAAVRGFQAPPVAYGNVAFVVGVGMFFGLGVVRLVLDW